MPPTSPKKTWADAKILLAAVSLAATLGFWNLFAGSNLPKKTAQSVGVAATEPPAVTQVSMPQVPMPHVKILLGGPAPQQRTASTAPSNPAKPGRSSKQSQPAAPAPVTTTGSSK